MSIEKKRNFKLNRNAITRKGWSTNYKEVHSEINKLYSKIGKIGKKDIVCIRMSNSVEAVLSVLMCYTKKITFIMVNDDNILANNIIEYSKPKIVLTREMKLNNVISDNVRVDIKDDSVGINYDNIMCINYTSGSTGMPKGVYVNRVMIDKFIKWYINKFKLCKNDKFGQLIKFGHDPILREIITAYQLKSELVLPSKEEYLNINNWIDKNNINVVHVIPDIEIQYNKKLKFINYVADKIYNKMTLKYGDKIKVINSYGLTETPQIVLYGDNDNKKKSGIVIMNKTVPGYIVDIIDKEGKRIENCHTQGQIRIKNKYIKYGYFNSVNSNHKSGVCLTGDYGKICNNGIIIQGRMDRQIKTNGFRINLDNLEERCRKINGIKDLVVLSVKKLIYVYYEKKDDKINNKEIEKEVISRLNRWEKPEEIVQINAIPKKVNGKVDYVYLENRINDRKASNVGIIEKVICKELGLTQIDTRLSLIELGANSIDIVKILDKLRDQKMNIDYVDIISLNIDALLNKVSKK